MFPFITVKKTYLLEISVEKFIMQMKDLALKENLQEYNLSPQCKTTDQRNFQFSRYYFRMNRINTSTYLTLHIIPIKGVIQIDINFRTNPIWWVFITLTSVIICIKAINGLLLPLLQFLTIGFAVVIFIDWSTKKLMLASFEQYLYKNGLLKHIS